MMLKSLFLLVLFTSAVLAQLSATVCPLTSPTPTAPQLSKTSTNKTPTTSSSNTAPLFADRTYTVVRKPAFLNSASFVQLFNDDKGVIGSAPYVNISLAVPSLLYIAFDSRATALPAWLNSANWRKTTSTILRQDSPSNLLMNLYVSTASSKFFSLGAATAAPAARVDSMYVPFVIPDFECNYFTFSDNFDRADGGPGARYAGGVEFPGLVDGGEFTYRTDWYILNGNLYTNASGYLQAGALSLKSYPHTAYTLQTRATSILYAGWGSYFMFGAKEIDVYSESYKLTLFGGFGQIPKISLQYYSPSTFSTTLASANFPGATTSTYLQYQITKTDAGLISVYASNTTTLPSTPLFTVTDTRLPSLNHYGWAQTTEPPKEAIVQYVNACGRVCA